MADNDSVGKISLDLEIGGDFTKQINEAASKISQQIKSSFENLNFKGLADSISNTIKKSVEESMKSVQATIESTLNKAVSGAAATAKKIKLPFSFDMPTNSATPEASTVRSTAQPRAPPMGGVSSGVNFEVVKAQIDNLTKSLDVTNAKIEQQKEKLAQLKESYNLAFSESRKNKLQEEILKTEANILKLTAASDKAGFKLADLDAQLAALGTTAKEANVGVNAISNSLGRTAGVVTKTINGLKSLGNSVKNTSNSSRNAYGSFNMFFDSLIRWGIVFPIIISGLTAMATAIGSSLMINAQFANSFLQIKSNLMTAFTPIYEAVLPALNALMSALATATAYIAAFVSALFGQTYAASFSAAQGLQSSIGAYNQQEKAAKNAATALGSAGSAAKKAAKEAKGSVAAFDEVNQLQLNKDPAGAGSGVVHPITPMANMSPIEASTAVWAEKFKAILGTLFNPLKAAWTADGAGVMAEFRNAIDATIGTLGHFFAVLATPSMQLFIENIAKLILAIIKLGLRIYDGFILPIINWFIGLLPGAAAGLNPIIEVVTKFINYLSGPGFGYVQLFLSAILGLVAGFMAFNAIQTIRIAILDFIAILQYNWAVLLANPIVAVIALIVALGVAFTALYASNEAFRTKVNEVAGSIGNFFTPVLLALKGTLLDIWNNALVPLGKMLIDLGITIIMPLAKIIKDILAVAFTTVAGIAKNLWSLVLVPLGSFLKDTFINIIRSVIDIYNAWKPVIQGVIDVIMFLWNNALLPLLSFLGSTFVVVFQGVFSTIGSIINNLKTIFNGIIDFITGVFTGNWGKAWNGVKETFSGIVGLISGIFKGVLNITIDVINSAIKGVVSAINKLIQGAVSLMNKIPGVNVNIKTITAPQIPKLARGGIIDQPTLAMVGEAGKEAVVPLENTEFVDTLASAVANAILAVMQFSKGNNSSSDDVRDIILQLDGTTLARILRPYMIKEDYRVGNTLIVKSI